MSKNLSFTEASSRSNGIHQFVHPSKRSSIAITMEFMSAALSRSSKFLFRFGRRFCEARQAKADHEVKQRRYFYRYCDRLE